MNIDGADAKSGVTRARTAAKSLWQASQVFSDDDGDAGELETITPISNCLSISIFYKYFLLLSVLFSKHRHMAHHTREALSCTRPAILA